MFSRIKLYYAHALWRFGLAYGYQFRAIPHPRGKKRIIVDIQINYRRKRGGSSTEL